MEQIYDIFEKRPDGLVWHSTVSGFERAMAALKEVATKSPYECALMHLPTNTVIVRIVVPK